MKKVVVQGLGHVGIAMAAAVASARDVNGSPMYSVVGLDLPNEAGRHKVDSVNVGECPVETNDDELKQALAAAHRTGNLAASIDPDPIADADIVVVDIPLDVDDIEHDASVPWDGFKAAITTIGKYASAGTLVLVETTVPPGTCVKIVRPILDAELQKRGLSGNTLLLAHSYERVMPGKDYFRSVTNFWRVFAGETPAAGDACRDFLEKVINTADFPLAELSSTTASETAKVLENSFRAINIALVKEFSDFAEQAGVDLFEVVDAIRVRPTHRNLMRPGFGVGGYCLTKDPMMTAVAAKEFFDLDLDFPFCRLAVRTNKAMPLHVTERLRDRFGSLSGKCIAIMGVTYREDVGDTRMSPSEDFLHSVEGEGATTILVDPLVDHWADVDRAVTRDLPRNTEIDVYVFAVRHREFANIDFSSDQLASNTLIVDANGVLSDKQISDIRNNPEFELLRIGQG